MPVIPPLASSGGMPKRPRAIPPKVREAVRLMVYGKLDDPDCKPLSFIAAANAAGIKPDVMRRYLDRADVRALLRAERRAFRLAICAGTEAALMRVRDTAQNGMAVVASVRALELLDVEAEARAPAGSSPGITIYINDNPSTPQSAPALTAGKTITVPYRQWEAEPEAEPNPFRNLKPHS